MNDEQKYFAKLTGLMLLSAIIGGIIAGCLTGCMMKSKKYHLYHHMDNKGCSHHHGYKKELYKLPYVEEDFIIIPKAMLEKELDKPSPFNGPRPPRTREE